MLPAHRDATGHIATAEPRAARSAPRDIGTVAVHDDGWDLTMNREEALRDYFQQYAAYISHEDQEDVMRANGLL